jgi:hypothetical protein
MTKMNIEGTERSIDLTADQFLKHSESITHWVNGGAVEEQYGDDWVSVISEPAFHLNTNYKPIEKYIRPGEVWIDKEGIPFIATVNDSLQDLNGQQSITPIPEQISKQMTYAGSSVEAYFSQRRVNI